MGMKFFARVIGFIVLLIIILLLLQKYGEQKQPAAAVAASTPTPAVTSTPVTTPVAAVAPSAPQLPGNFLQAIQRGGYGVSGSQFRDGWWYITVSGRDRNHLNDFLDLAQRSGLKDVDVNYQKYGQAVVGGRTVFQNTYKMKF